MKKNPISRILSIALTILMLSSALVSCNFGSGEQTTEEVTTAVPEESTTLFEEPISIPLTENGTTKFTLLKPIGVSDDLLDVIIDFRDSFKSKTGINIELEYEDEDEAVNDDFEILIGKTTRPESAEKSNGLKSKDYFYGIVGNKLVITGGTADSIQKAINHFVRNVIDKAEDKKNITLSLENNYYSSGTYFINTFKIGDVDLANFKIVYADKDYYAAEVFARRLQENIRAKVGYTIPIISDSESATANEIVIGTTNRGGPKNKERSYSIKYEGGKLYMASDYSAGYETLLQYVVSNIFTQGKEINLKDDVNVEKDLTGVFKNGTENVFSKTGVRLLFNNIWSGNEASAPAKLRAQQLADVYRDYDADVIGLQEYSGAVKTELAKQLKELGYVEIPYTNSNNTSIVPRTPIYYNPNTLVLKDSGFWRYGDTSGDVSKAVGWAVFEEKASGKLFIAGSTHFWWKSEVPQDNENRKIDARELCELMISLSTKYDAPVIVGGDYNCRLESDPINIILKDKKFVEAEDIAKKTEFGGTHHAYPTFNVEFGYANTYFPASGTYKTAIDHIFMYNQEKLDVHLYDVVEDFFALASSDHCPMITDITLK